MNKRGHLLQLKIGRWAAAILVVVVVASGLMIVPSAASPPKDGRPPVSPPLPGPRLADGAGSARVESSLRQAIHAMSFEGSQAAADALRAASLPAIELPDGADASRPDQPPTSTALATRVVLEASPGDPVGPLQDSVATAGGRVELVEGSLVQAVIPIRSLETIAGVPNLRAMRSPRRPYSTVENEAVELVHADAWQALSTDGAGIKIGILDIGFDGYGALLGSELPASVQAFSPGGDISACSLGGCVEHGTGVAEVVHDMAPGAELYLTNATTDVEFYSAVNWLVNNKNVDIISHSVAWFDVGPYNGNSSLAGTVDSAAAGGTLWVNSAGNYADAHWEGNGPSGSFPYEASDCQAIYFAADQGQSIVGLLSWDDWGATGVDYDFYLWMWEGTVWGTAPVAYSENDQQGGYPEPVEEIITTAPQSTYYAFEFCAWNAPSGGYLDLFTPGTTLDILDQVPEGSIPVPADASGALAVGATCWQTDALEPFSSQGPTNGANGGAPDGTSLIKPDLVAPDGVSTSTYGSAVPAGGCYSGFTGTSAAAPNTAGAAALVMEANPSFTVNDVRSWLASHAIERGAAGKDNLYGDGRLDLGRLNDVGLSLINSRTPDSLPRATANLQWFTQVTPTEEGLAGDAFRWMVWLQVPDDWQLRWSRSYSFSGDFTTGNLTKDYASLPWVENAANCPAGGPADPGTKWQAWSSPYNVMPAAGDRLNNKVNLRGGFWVPASSPLGSAAVRIVPGLQFDSDHNGSPDSYVCMGMHAAQAVITE